MNKRYATAIAAATLVGRTIEINAFRIKNPTAYQKTWTTPYLIRKNNVSLE